MLNQDKVPMYLVNELPGIEDEYKSILTCSDFPEAIKYLAKYTKDKVIQHDLKLVKKCFVIADNFYCQGDTKIKNVIEKIFICAFSALINSGAKDEKRKLHALIPLSLYTAYMQQVLKPATG